jgi:hypothetical protein
MYDMYPWDSASQGDYPPQPLRSVRNPARRAPKPRNGSAVDGSTLDGSTLDGTARNGGANNGGANSSGALNGHARDITPAQAVQIALDRRDNGGEATRTAARPAAWAATATLPAASQARQ